MKETSHCRNESNNRAIFSDDYFETPLGNASCEVTQLLLTDGSSMF